VAVVRPSSGPIRFGTFEVDPNAGELRKRGVRVKLQEQPLQILQVLLERPGEMVTREELQQRVWPADTFVDFDHGLYNAVKRLREALGDTAETPRFIETLPRRGYRFIAPLNGIPPSAAGAWRIGTTIPSAAALIVIMAILFVWLQPLPPPRVLASKQITNDGLQKFGLVTDGNRIYITETVGSRRTIAQVSVTGGQVESLDVPLLNPVVLDVSPGGSELLVTTASAGVVGAPFWSVPIPAGSPRRLGDAVGHYGVWTAGRELIFAQANDIYVADHDGNAPRKIATVPDLPGDFRFSPDHTRIRFTVSNFASNKFAIWEANADGSQPHPLLPGWNNPPQECCGDWTPDGKYYVFQSVRDGVSNVWLLPNRRKFSRRVSSEPVQLTAGPVQFYGPVFSKDGKKLFVIGYQPRAELVRYDPKSGALVPYLGGMSMGDLDFTRDGEWVTYVSYPEGTLWRSRLDGSERLQLTSAPIRAALAHWSPDGQQIAFSGATPGKPWRIFLISKEGGSPRPIVSEERNQTDPTWSRDGQTLAFGLTDPAKAELSSIKLLDLKSGRISQLTNSQGVFGPRWSPDGRYIAAISYDGSRLMLFDVQAQRWRNSSVDVGVVGYMAWSSDSANLYFDDLFVKDPGYFRLRIKDSRLERILNLKEVRTFPSQFGPGTWTGLGPGEVPLLVRDISTQEIYELDLQLP